MRCSACRTQVRRSNTFDTHIRKCTGSGYVLQTDFSGNHKQFQMIMKTVGLIIIKKLYWSLLKHFNVDIQLQVND